MIVKITRTSELKLKIVASEGIQQLMGQIKKENFKIFITSKNLEEINFDIASNDSERGILNIKLNISIPVSDGPVSNTL